MSEDIIGRSEAEEIIKSAIDDYVDIETLQSMLDLIHGPGESMVVEDMSEINDEE